MSLTVYEEADNKAAEKNIDDNREGTGTAMFAGQLKGKKGRKGKQKPRSERADLQCGNCKRKGHVEKDCFAEGGRKEKEAPEWWKKKVGKAKGASANVADTQEENYSLLAAIDSPNTSPPAGNSSFAEALAATQTPVGSVIIDCSAMNHFSPKRSKFLHYQAITPVPITAANGESFNAIGRADMKVDFLMGEGEPTKQVTLCNVHYVPKMNHTLVSVVCIVNACFITIMNRTYCTIICESNDKVIGRIPLVRGLYRVTDVANPYSNQMHAAYTSRKMSITKLHRLMDHINHDDLFKMVHTGMITGIKLDMSSKPEFCSICVQSKAANAPFSKESQNADTKSYGNKVLSDVWGPVQTRSLGGNNYAMLNHDKSSHEFKVYFMVKKSETLNRYKRYASWMKVQRNAPNIKIFQSDRGSEYTSKEFSDYLDHQGTIQHLNVHDSPNPMALLNAATARLSALLEPC